MAQPTKSQPFKHANTFILRTTDDKASALHILQGLLAQHGFTLQQPEDSTHVLTQPRTLRQGRHVDSFQVLATTWPLPADQLSVTQLIIFAVGPLALSYCGKETSLSKQAFHLVEAVAKAYPNAQLLYQANQ